MNLTNIELAIEIFIKQHSLLRADEAVLRDANLWDDVMDAYPAEMSTDQIIIQLTQIFQKRSPTGNLKSFIVSWFRNLYQDIEAQNITQARNDCPYCNSNQAMREEHIRRLARQYYTEWAGAPIEPEQRDIPSTIEKVYQHARCTFNQDKAVRRWVKEEICRVEGWPIKPLGEQTDAEREAMKVVTAMRGYAATY